MGPRWMEPRSSTSVAFTWLISPRFSCDELFAKIFRARFASGRVREVCECWSWKANRCEVKRGRTLWCLWSTSWGSRFFDVCFPYFPLQSVSGWPLAQCSQSIQPSQCCALSSRISRTGMTCTIPWVARIRDLLVSLWWLWNALW